MYNPSTGYSDVPCPHGLCPDPDLNPLPRWHFDYFAPALMTVFVLMTGEWVDAMVPAVGAYGLPAVLFFVLVVLLGRYLLINLLIAIVLESFADDSDSPSLSGKEVAGSLNDMTSRTSRTSVTSRTSIVGDTARLAGDGREEAAALLEEVHSGYVKYEWPRDYSFLCFSPRNILRRSCLVLATSGAFDNLIILAIIASSVCLALDTPRLDDESELAANLKLLDIYLWPWIFGFELMVKAIAFGFLYGDSPRAYLKSPWNQLDFVIVMASFVVFATEEFPALAPLKNLRVLRVLRPLRLVSRSPGMRQIIASIVKALPAVGNVVGVILALMVVFAVLGMQLYMGKLGTCTDPSILTKGACVPTTAISSAYVNPVPVHTNGRLLLDGPSWAPPLAAPQLYAGGLAAGDGVRFDGLLDGKASVPVSAQLLSSAALGANGTLAVQAAAGALRRTRRALKGSSSGTWDGTVTRWANPRVGSFDDFASAMLILYVMSTGDEWEKDMYRMMDATPPGIASERNDYSLSAVFSIFWIFVSSFFAMNLFVGVVVDNFNRIKAESDGTATMTAEQLQWVQTMKAMVSTAGPQRVNRVPEGCFRRGIYNLVTSSIFDGFIMTVIVGNVAVMACDFWGIEQHVAVHHWYLDAMTYFAYIYYTEATLKITGLGPIGYWAESWNRFDFTLVLITVFDQYASELLADILPVPPMLLRALRVLRVARILRLLKSFKELRSLIVTMIYSFPSLINVGSLLALIVFMYAVLGVDLFTYVAHQEAISSGRNFESLGNAALLLFQCLTNDAWSGIMTDAMVDEQSGGCVEAEGNCGSWIAIPYFISFQILGSFIMLNLVVAVILENFSSIGGANPDLVTGSDLERFREIWARFDPDADFYIRVEALPQLVASLPPPMGLQGTVHGGGAAELRAARKLCTALHLQQYDGKMGEVAYIDVLNALIKHNFTSKNVSVDTDTFRAKVQKMVPIAPSSPPPDKVHKVFERSKTQAITLSPPEKLARDLNLSLQQRFAFEAMKEHLLVWIGKSRERAARLAEELAKRGAKGKAKGAKGGAKGGQAPAGKRPSAPGQQQQGKGGGSGQQPRAAAGRPPPNGQQPRGVGPAASQSRQCPPPPNGRWGAAPAGGGGARGSAASVSPQAQGAGSPPPPAGEAGGAGGKPKPKKASCGMLTPPGVRALRNKMASSGR